MLPGPGIDPLSGPLPLYFGAQTQQDTTLPALIPDAVAAAYIISPQTASTTPGVVEIVAGKGVPELVQGQSVIAVNSSDPLFPGTNEQISMILDDATQSRAARAVFKNVPPNTDILVRLTGPYIASPPTNANVVTSVRPTAIRRLIFRQLTQPLPIPGTEVQASDLDTQSEEIFLPIAPYDN